MPDAAELVAAADTLAQANLYTEAISTYTNAIELTPTSPTYYIKRYLSALPSSYHSSTAYQRSGDLVTALKVSYVPYTWLIYNRMQNKLFFLLNDEEKRTLLPQHKSGGGKRAAYITDYRISLNGLKRYADSNECFLFAKKSGSKDKSMDIWISKNNRELAKRKIHGYVNLSLSFRGGKNFTARCYSERIAVSH